MEKQDLKCGMVVETIRKHYLVVIDDKLFGIYANGKIIGRDIDNKHFKKRGYMNIKQYTEDLIFIDDYTGNGNHIDPELNIVKVYSDMLAITDIDGVQPPLWIRGEEKWEIFIK